ncbi:MAG: efflux RND transporter periplasmic adaptor subunit [Terriglobia bacterium]
MVFSVCVVVLGLSSCSSKPAEPAAPSAAARPTPAPVAAEPAEPPEILSVLSVERVVDLVARREGVVVAILRDVGARVNEGEVLARLDDRDLVAELEKARAELEHNRFRVKYNEADVRAKDAAYKRALEMKEYALISDADVEKAQFEIEAARFSRESARLGVAYAEASVRQLELELEKTRIRAPFAGVVVRRYLRPGQAVAKEEKCYRLSELYPLLVKFLVPESGGERPRRGDPVNVTAVMSDSEQVYTARVKRVSPVIDPGSAAIEVTAQLVGPDLRGLRPGMAVRILWGREEKP